MSRYVLTAALFAAVLWAGVVYAAIHTVTADMEADW
jgi:hypothetical protein